ncbi:MAG TPA: serine/threonine-protein kinase [Candidatus Aquilonibacter sp.]|nr:serine/threonine-protein kinase [Candidatus Aquilonibacter sp.]
MARTSDRGKERFGRYEILAELGRGAMGIVYKARDPKINRVVAVKTISLAGQPPQEVKEYRERFFREAEAAGRLSHPGIVTVFDVGEEPETHAPYIVMEYVPGQTLDKLLLSREDHKMPAEQALQLTLEVAEALDCAHGQGVVHRDIKPANILLTKEGRAKIADFGVAKLNLANATAPGRVFGTPAFMSPEQLNDEEIDGRSDLFSLGVILYTALTGYKPFQGNSMMTVAFKVVNRDPVPVTVLDTELPPGLDYIISRAIAKDRSQRYQRGMEIVFDIQELRAGREPWSKAKEHNSGGPFQNSNDKRAGARPINVASAPNSSHKNLLEHGSITDLLEQVRGRYFVSAFLLLAVLFFAVRISQFRWSRHSLRNNLTATTLIPQPMPQETNLAADALPRNVQTTLASASATSTNMAKQTVSAKLFKKQLTRPPVQVAQVPPAMLDIEVDHNFAEARLSIWVDDHLSFTHALEGAEKKRLVVFHHVEGHEFHAMQVPAGKHALRVQVISESSQQTETIRGTFSSSAEEMLRIRFDKSGKMNLDLQ